MGFGERIKKARNRTGLTQQEAANEANISRSYLADLENNRYNPSISTLENIADALNTTPAYLMGWTDDPHNWEQIGNDQGIYPPKDYEGSYEDYVKYKVMQEQDDILDKYYDTFESAVQYLKNLGCEVIEEPAGSNDVIVITPDDERLKTDVSTLVYNFTIFGSSHPGVRKLVFRQDTASQDNEASNNPVSPTKQAIDTVAAHLDGKDITPKKLKLIEQYIDALFDDDEDD